MRLPFAYGALFCIELDLVLEYAATQITGAFLIIGTSYAEPSPFADFFRHLKT